MTAAPRLSTPWGLQRLAGVPCLVGAEPGEPGAFAQFSRKFEAEARFAHHAVNAHEALVAFVRETRAHAELLGDDILVGNADAVLTILENPPWPAPMLASRRPDQESG